MSGVAGHSEPEQPRTSRKWRVIAVMLLLVLLAPATWLARRGASRLEFFHLKAVEVQGTRYLTPETVLERLALDTTRSVWDDTQPLVDKLLLLPQVSAVEIRRRLPGILVIVIRENLPVALVPTTSGLEPVDSAGIVLPIDPTRDSLDLPVVSARDLSLLELLSRVRARHPVLYRRISEISLDGNGDVLLLLLPLRGESAIVAKDTVSAGSAQSNGSGDVIGSGELATAAQPAAPLRIRARVGVSVSRLADIFPVESDLLRRRANVAELDLRYRDQVIARLQ